MEYKSLMSKIANVLRFITNPINYMGVPYKERLDERYIHDIDLRELSFTENNNGVYTLTTKYHKVKYYFNDIGRLEIKSTDKGEDEVYLRGYFKVHEFKQLLKIITEINL